MADPQIPDESPVQILEHAVGCAVHSGNECDCGLSEWLADMEREDAQAEANRKLSLWADLERRAEDE